MASRAHIDGVKALHISGPVIMTARPGRDLQSASVQAWRLARPQGDHGVVAGGPSWLTGSSGSPPAPTVAAVATVASVISYRHTYGLVIPHGEPWPY